MGEATTRMSKLRAPKTRELPPPPSWAKRSRPQGYVEWRTLREWGKLPPWEPLRPGYLLRAAREGAGLTQEELAGRLGVSQQAVARAEGCESNPTVSLMERWASACDAKLEIGLTPSPRKAD